MSPSTTMIADQVRKNGAQPEGRKRARGASSWCALFFVLGCLGAGSAGGGQLPLAEGPLRAALVESGLQDIELRPWFRKEKHQLFLVSAAAPVALEFWHHLRRLSVDTGYLPVLMSDPREIAELREHGEGPGGGYLVYEQGRKVRYQNFAATLRGAAETNVEAWLQGLAESDPEYRALPRGEAATDSRADAEESSRVAYSADPHGAETRRWTAALVPTTKSWEIPVYLRFGGWNLNPAEHIHGAAVRMWNLRHGAEVLAMEMDTLELWVARPPADEATSLAAAAELVAYCPDEMGGFEILDEMVPYVRSTIWTCWWD